MTYELFSSRASSLSGSTSSDAFPGSGLRPFDAGPQQPALVGRALADGFLGFDDFDLARLRAARPILRSAVKISISPVGAVLLIIVRSVTIAIGVSSEIAVDRFDQVDARVAFAKHHHPRVVDVIERGQPFAPTADHLIGIEQRHARIVGDVERLAIAFAD